MASNNSDFCPAMMEVTTVLASGDDAEELQKVVESCQKAKECEKIRNSRTKRLLEALAKMKEEVENSKILLAQENKENKENMLALEDKKRETKTEIENLNGELASVEKDMKHVEGAVSKVKEEKADVQREAIEVLPKTKYAFSLYSNITRLRWDYEAEEDHLKGFVASLRDVRPFDVNVKENNKYFVANYLWDVISSS